MEREMRNRHWGLLEFARAETCLRVQMMIVFEEPARDACLGNMLFIPPEQALRTCPR